MRHINKYKLFEGVEVDDDLEIDSKVSGEMIEKVKTCYNFIKNLKVPNVIKLGDARQGWWDPKYSGRPAWVYDHESFKITVNFRVGLSEYFIDRKSYGVEFPMPDDTSKYLKDLSKLMIQTDTLVNKLKPYGDIKVSLIDDQMSCRVYIIMENKDTKSLRDTKVRRLAKLLDDYFSKSDNDHSSKSMNIFNPYPGKNYSTGKYYDSVKEQYKDIYEILCDLESLKNVWNPKMDYFRLRHTYSSKIEGESIIIKFSPLKYKINDERIKPLVVDEMYKNILNVEVGKIIRERIGTYSAKDIISDFDIRSKGDIIKITLK